MPKSAHFLGLSFILASSLAMARAQGNLSTVGNPVDLKTIVVAAVPPSDSVVAVPPATSVTVSLSTKRSSSGADGVDLRRWLNKESAFNGLQSSNLQPWHIVVTYDQFDEDGDNVHSGTFEEYWAGPQRFKRVYKSDDFNQTDYATDNGLFRSGNQGWPNRAQSQVRAEVLDPFSYATTLQDVRARNLERIFSGYKLQCVVIERSAGISDPTQYCFEPDSHILRYSRGFGWFQTVYNRIIAFQGRNLAQDVDVTDGGRPYLKLRVQTIELISRVDDALFHPPSDAVGPLGDRVSGIFQMPKKMTYPRWPTSLKGQHFTVTVEIVIGKDGHVISAHGVSGPPEGYKACENAVRKWIFAPYLVLNRPVEVEQKVQCSNN